MKLLKNLIVVAITLPSCCIYSLEVFATEVWDGPSVTITKAGGVQTIDSITPGVSLTRGGSAGVYNPEKESSWTAISPRGTEWAFAGINGNPNDASLTASNYQNLTFDTWLLALGGTGMAGANIENRPGVLHLVDEDIYIDFLFTFWEPGPTESGDFSYTRSSAPAQVATRVPMPTTMLGILFVAVIGLNCLFVQRST